MATQQACTTEEGLEPLLRHPAIWRARDRHTRPACGQPSGYPALDECLPEQGWPRNGLVEILCDRSGIGELQLLMPLLSRLSTQDSRWISWIRPPFVPYAPALASQQVRLDRLLWVRTRNDRETLWATHQSLGAGSCSLVLGWVSRDILAGESRRLQVGAGDSDSLCILFRPQAAAQQSSSAVLRLSLRPRANGLQVETRKSRGSWPAAPVQVALADAPGFQPERMATLSRVQPAPRESAPAGQADLFQNQRALTVHVPSLSEPPTPLSATGNPSPGSAPRSRAFL